MGAGGARFGAAFAAAAALGSLALLQLTFPSTLFFWDEFQLAYGVLEFDLTRHQPHPPGYVLFVWLGRLLLPVAGDPALALRWLAALATALFAALAVGRGPEGLSAPAAALFAASAAIFTLASPLVGRFGVVGLTYAVEGVAWTAWLLAFAARPRQHGIVLLFLFAGLMGGLRPTLTLWAGAFLAWAALAPGAWIPRSRLLPLAATLCGGVGLWLLALFWESGGIAAWREASSALTGGNIWAKSVFARGPEGLLTARLIPMFNDLVRGLGLLAALSVGVLTLRSLSRNAALVRLDPLAAGGALVIGFYAVLLYDTSGYLVAAAMPLAVHALRGSAILAARRPPLQQLAAGAGILVCCTLVALAPDGLTPNERYDVHDALLEARFEAVRQATSPTDTVLVTSQEYRDYGLRHVAHYLPQYPTLQLVRDDFFSIVSSEAPYLVSQARELRAQGPAELDLASLIPERGLRHVVYMLPPGDDGFIAASCSPLSRSLPVGNGEHLQIVDLEPGRRVIARHQRLHCPR